MLKKSIYVLEEVSGRSGVPKINPYKPCVANKMVDVKQLIVYWNVDKLKISCVNKNEVAKMIRWIDSEY